MGRFAFHILTVSFQPRPNAEWKSSRLSPADVEKLNHGDRFQLKLKACLRISSLLSFFSWSCTVTFAKIAARVQSTSPPDSPSFIFSNILRRSGGEETIWISHSEFSQCVCFLFLTHMVQFESCICTQDVDKRLIWDSLMNSDSVRPTPCL